MLYLGYRLILHQCIAIKSQNNCECRVKIKEKEQRSVIVLPTNQTLITQMLSKHNPYSDYKMVEGPYWPEEETQSHDNTHLSPNFSF